MSKSLTTLSLMLAVLIGSTGVSYALPECPGSPSLYSERRPFWTNCTGTRHFFSEGKYVGDFKDDAFHGQGRLRDVHGNIKEGIFENGKFLHVKNISSKPIAENNSSTKDIQSRLAKLKDLEDAGLITKEEAAEKRKAILDSL
jgi:hypothetical protein